MKHTEESRRIEKQRKEKEKKKKKTYLLAFSRHVVDYGHSIYDAIAK